MKLSLIFAFFFVIQHPSMGDQDDGKIPSIDDPCAKLAQDYNQVSQNLHAYKRDYYIVICLIIVFSALGIIMCYLMKRRNGTDPRWQIGNFSI